LSFEISDSFVSAYLLVLLSRVRTLLKWRELFIFGSEAKV